jgi:hypothetical protein
LTIRGEAALANDGNALGKLGHGAVLVRLEVGKVICVDKHERKRVG